MQMPGGKAGARRDGGRGQAERAAGGGRGVWGRTGGTFNRLQITSFSAEGHHPWTTAGVSGDLNQAALMAIIDGYRHWLINSHNQSEALTAQHSLVS